MFYFNIKIEMYCFVRGKVTLGKAGLGPGLTPQELSVFIRAGVYGETC